MSANITEIIDKGENPNTPSIEEMRESQRVGRVGIGTNEKAYGEDQRDFNMQGCVPEGHSEEENTPSQGSSRLQFLGIK